MNFHLLNRTKYSVIGLVLLLMTMPYFSFAQNDACGSAPTITPVPICTTPTNGTLAAAATYTAIGTNCGFATDDVWYTFFANSTNPTITYTAGTLVNGRIALYRNGCGSLTAVGTCDPAVLSPTGLTIGTQYWIRIFSTSSANTGTFSICVVDGPPANDECTGAVQLTPALSVCGATTPGNMYAASPSAEPIAPCTGPVVYDEWYYFIAPSSQATVTLSGIGTSINTPRMQLLSGFCGGLVSVACGTTSVTSAALVPGNYYYVRVYASAGTIPMTTTNLAFNICVTYTVPAAAPANDLCANAVVLTPTPSCNKVMGTMVNATNTPGVPAPSCGATVNGDVWYKFTATSTSTTLNINDYGANFSSANRRVQVLTGTCGSGSLSAFTCVNANSAVLATTIGTVYFLRVTTTGTVPTTFGDFSICVFNTPSAQRYGNSYTNVTKQTTGGPVENGDILEIRMTIHHTSGTITKIRYLDSIPTKTVIDSTQPMRVQTNEGIVLKNWTVVPDADPASFVLNPGAGNYQVRMNLNFNGTAAPPNATAPANMTTTENASATGQLTVGNVPNIFGNSLFVTAFRVRVTGVAGDTIRLGAGKFIYNNGTSDITLTGTPYQILITAPMSLCTNATGVNTADEFGGTFGTGTTLNRGTDLTSPIQGYTFVNVFPQQNLGDGQYAIVKNMSPRSGTNNNAERSPNSAIALPNPLSYQMRMHGGHWDIDGDHTGTANNIGNAATADGVNAGYMLMVNADYVASETYRQSINNLCPNTYYEFSAWFRNICPTCGNDHTTGSNWSPRQPGVMPNLSFALDGLDRYTTGDIPYYNGAPALGWVKKGFVFLTGPTQTAATFSIRNNSQGGGGNDWVMDDVTVATCLPNMTYNPSNNPVVCQFNMRTIRDTVRSFFNNYTYYKWQRSTDGGATYFDVTLVQGPAAPYFNATLGVWEYVTIYGVAPAFTTPANNGDMYRVIAATTPGNIGSTNCVVTSGINFLTLNVLNCGTPLKTDVLSFNGKLVVDKANLSWTTSKEEEPLKYEIEKSFDGTVFTKIGVVNGYNNPANISNQYNFNDPATITGKTYYRVVAVTSDNKMKYSRTIELSLEKTNRFVLNNVVNPFNQVIYFDIHSPVETKIEAELLDMYGKVVKKKTYYVHSGISSLTIPETESLPTGTYILRVHNNEQAFSRKIMKRAQ